MGEKRMVKRCNRCNRTDVEFGKDKRAKDGKLKTCKECLAKAVQDAKHTKKGLIARIYSQQKARSRKRGHMPPAYTLKDFRDWLLGQKRFHTLFKIWENNNYDRHYIPSIDRLDNTHGYSFGNIRLVDWDTNDNKEREAKKNGSSSRNGNNSSRN